MCSVGGWLHASGVRMRDWGHLFPQRQSPSHDQGGRYWAWTYLPFGVMGEWMLWAEGHQGAKGQVWAAAVSPAQTKQPHWQLGVMGKTRWSTTFSEHFTLHQLKIFCGIYANLWKLGAGVVQCLTLRTLHGNQEWSLLLFQEPGFGGRHLYGRAIVSRIIGHPPHHSASVARGRITDVTPSKPGWWGTSLA